MDGNESPSLPGHLAWLIDTRRVIETEDGGTVRILELLHQDDEQVLSAWAKHLRNHYCQDDQLDELRKGTRYSRAEYLQEIKFPDSASPPGPSIRAGDFGEVLVADYLEFILEYWVPRTRYDHKAIRNESTKGTDLIGFKLVAPREENPDDALALFEAKAQFTGGRPTQRLQAAVDGSAKDELRIAESLNAIKQRMLDLALCSEASTVERFQNPEDRPYSETYGAVALLSTSVLDEEDIRSTDTSAHPRPADLTLIVIHGNDLMTLVHELYRRAADEA
jgi:HamA